MPVGRAWYVHGQKLAFPYGERWVSGPFDDMRAAFDEARRLRPFYPDATLSARIRSGKTLPEAKPRTAAPGDKEPETPQLSVGTAKGRREVAEAIAGLARALGFDATVEDWDGEPDVDIATPSLNATVWVGKTGLPIISWYGAAFPLRAVPGAWGADDVNAAHRAKATSKPADWAELFAMLETGLLAAIDGRAFELEN